MNETDKQHIDIMSHTHNTTSTSDSTSDDLIVTKPKLNLVLDLDETLLHTISVTHSQEELIKTYCVMPNMLFHYCDENNHYIMFYRPNVLKFIENIVLYFNVYIYTNATHFYTNLIVVFLINQLKYNPFKQIKCRDEFSTNFAKYLHILNLDKSNTIILDDHVDVWVDDKENQIMIKQFIVDHMTENYLQDNELDKILTILKNINIEHNSILSIVSNKLSLTQIIKKHNIKYGSMTYMSSLPSINDLEDIDEVEYEELP